MRPPTNADGNVWWPSVSDIAANPACPETLTASAQRTMLEIEATFTGSQAL